MWGKRDRESDNPAVIKAGRVGTHVFNPRGVQVFFGALAFGKTELESKWQHFELWDEKHKAEIKNSEYLQH